MQIVTGDQPPLPNLPDGVVFGKNSLALPNGLTFEQWKAIGIELRSCYLALNWWVGDWLAYGQESYKDHVHGQRLENGVARFAAELFGVKEGTLRIWKYVCSNVNLLSRHNNLTFSHAYEIATIAPAHHIDMWVKRMQEEPLTKLELRRTMRQFYATEPIEENDGPVESLIETTRQFVRDFLRIQAQMEEEGTWTPEVQEGYRKELARVFEKIQESYEG